MVVLDVVNKRDVFKQVDLKFKLVQWIILSSECEIIGLLKYAEDKDSDHHPSILHRQLYIPC